MEQEQVNEKFIFVGNRLWLDFVNTEIVKGVERVDLLGDFQDFLDWTIAAGVASKAQAAEKEKRWSETERQAALSSAREFRAALRETAERLCASRRVKDSAIDLINQFLRDRAGYMELRRNKRGYEKHFHSEMMEASQLLSPAADSAADSLSLDDLSLIRKCENPSCILFFYDVSKNHVRRWCSMSACGNRMKAAAHYERKRGVKQ